MSGAHRLTAVEAARLIQRRELSAEQLMQDCLAHIEAREGAVQAFVRLDAASALAQARALDAGALRGPLHGLPLAVKDIFDSADMPTECGSPIFAGHQPRVDAAAVALCREAGAIVIGKTVTTELANMTAGATRHPLNPMHSPGGSSSGSAAAVADAMVPLALGTQTAGSIVRPAAYCGVVGIKPSFGRVPRAGVKPNADSMDTVGGFGRTVADAALLASVLTSDSRLRETPLPETLRIGLAPGPDWAQADADVATCWERTVRALGPVARCDDAALPVDFAEVAAVQSAIQAAETVQALAFEYHRHRAQLSDALLALLDRGRAIEAVTLSAHRARAERWRREVDALFDRHDVLLTPSATGEAPGGLAFTGDPVFCRAWSLLGPPCVHLPLGLGATGLPVGLQLIGRHGDDHRLLAAAQWLMQRLA